jgi:hypothetical protein
MPKLSAKEIQFTGTLNNLTAYTMRGHNGIIIRSKGGASKRNIEKNPKFQVTRDLNKEWKAVIEASQSIRRGLAALRKLADYNVAGPLHALVKKIQTADELNPKGKRSILFSRHPDFLSSFQYNRQTLFDNIVCQPIEVNINKTSAMVDVTIPSLQPLVNFFPNPRYAYYRILLACGGVSDFVYSEMGNFHNPVSSQLPSYMPIYTEWTIAKVPQPSALYTLTPKEIFSAGPNMIFVFGVGIQYGMPGADGTIQPVPFAGAARIMKTI